MGPVWSKATPAQAEGRGSSVEVILRNISADQTIQLSVRERNSCLLGGEVVTHLVNSHEMFAVWRSYNFKDLKADLSQQERQGNEAGKRGKRSVDREKPAYTLEIFPDDPPVPSNPPILCFPPRGTFGPLGRHLSASLSAAIFQRFHCDSVIGIEYSPLFSSSWNIRRTNEQIGVYETINITLERSQNEFGIF